MNNYKKIIVGVLFIAVCSPPDALPIEHNSDNTHTQQMLRDSERSQARLALQDAQREINRNREIMEEIAKYETYRHINQGQEADILKDLLLESTDSGAIPVTTNH